MDEDKVIRALSEAESAVERFSVLAETRVTSARDSVEDICLQIKEEVSCELSLAEARLIRETALVADDAEFHLLRAYYHASPSLWALIVAIYGIVQTVIEVIRIINDVLKVITSGNLIYWINKLIPGFTDVWNDMMNKISEFSDALGWGVDGVLHLLNIATASTFTFSEITGKSLAWADSEMFTKIRNHTLTFKYQLAKIQENPGEWLYNLVHASRTENQYWSSRFINDLVAKADLVAGKAETLVTGLGTITDELAAVREGMPAVVAKYIPQSVWDGIERADTLINDRLLPAITSVNRRIDELDNLLGSYRKKADELADKIAHPGDMLAEIDKLPGYARDAQLVKIDFVTSALLGQQNDAAFAALEEDLREFGLVAAALSRPPAPLSFMELDLPGRAPGIVAEPRETWFVGDY